MESLMNSDLVQNANRTINTSATRYSTHGLRHTIFNKDLPYHVEVVVLVCLAFVGVVTNLTVIVTVFLSSRLRRASNAFLTHHCLLDLLKSMYCVVFAQSLVDDVDEAWCGLLGGSYIVFVTSSSFNLLALVMNEAYHFSDLTISIKDSRNCYCIVFGVFTIWFSSIIMNLGVVFIPRNPSFNRQLGRCVFIQGVTENYVLQVLWLSLITLSLAFTVSYLYKLHVDVKKIGYYRLSTLVRTTFQINPQATGSEETQDRMHIKWVQKVTRCKLYLMTTLTLTFAVFWYPLFVLAACDPYTSASRDLYKLFTMLAWSNSSLTPLLILLILKTQYCCHFQGVESSSDEVTCVIQEPQTDAGAEEQDISGPDEIVVRLMSDSPHHSVWTDNHDKPDTEREHDH